MSEDLRNKALEYKRLRITNAEWETRFILLDLDRDVNHNLTYEDQKKIPDLDFSRLYDIKFSDENEYKGCKVFEQNHPRIGKAYSHERRIRGEKPYVADKPYILRKGFFVVPGSGGKPIELAKGLLMRVS